jgi:hypothetical protein
VREDLACNPQSLLPPRSQPHTATIIVSSNSSRSLFDFAFHEFSPTLKKVRYNPDHLSNIQHATGILAPQLAYPQILGVQQSPLLEATVDVSKTDSHHNVGYSPELPLPSRSQQGLNFPVHLPAISTIPTFPSPTGQTDFSFQASSSRRLPGGPINNDSSYSDHHTSGIATDGDQGSSSSSADRRDPSSSASASGSRPQRKEISTVVIACRQW